MYDPKTNKYPYPLETDHHYLVVKKNDGTVFDRNYPYIDRSKWFRFRQTLIRILMYLIVFPLNYIRLGFRVKGRENLKKYRDVIDKGIISCSNHVHMWDYISIMNAVKPKRTNVLCWAPDVSGENGPLIRLTGGIPIPEGDLRATAVYVREVQRLLSEGGWLQIYPEGSMWEYYAPIRPFKHGASFFACRFDKPILPMGFSYREPGWVRKHIFHQIALFTLTIGEPLYPDQSLGKAEREEDLTKRCHAEICRLAGIEPSENIYPPVFNDSKRIDYYTTEYGIGYKGSW